MRGSNVCLASCSNEQPLIGLDHFIKQLGNDLHPAGHSHVFVPNDPIASHYRSFGKKTDETGSSGRHEVMADADAGSSAYRFELADGGRNRDIRLPVAD